MRSKSGLIGAVVLILGVPVALGSAIAFNGAGASEIIHVALAASFFLFAAAVVDFPLATWLRWVFAAGIAVLAAIFLLQAIADLTHSTEVAGVAYGILGQTLEKWLGYLFIVWCAVICLVHAKGVVRIAGLLALALVVGTEIYGFTVRASGQEPSQALKFLFLPLIAWVGGIVAVAQDRVTEAYSFPESALPQHRDASSALADGWAWVHGAGLLRPAADYSCPSFFRPSPCVG